MASGAGERGGAVPGSAVAADASNHHYDLPPRIFELFLDESLKYSVGLFERPGREDHDDRPGREALERDDDTLEAAQLRKLEFIARELRVGPGARVLDVGCGWGSLVGFLARRGCRVTGITPSPRQAEFIERRSREVLAAPGAGSVTVLRGTFEDQVGTAELAERSFDAIAFVGSIVHLPDKAAALARAHRLLAHHGRLYLSETCFRSEKRYAQFSTSAEFGFIRDEIFGWGDCVPVSRYVAQLESAGFSLAGMVDLTANYRRTIEEWRRRAERNRTGIDEICPGYTDRLLRYFDICNASWGFTTKQYALTAARER
jgi:cyclopropane-fatty-acyl-phospholipid synthase